MKVEIKTITDDGIIKQYVVNGSLEQLVYDAFLQAEYQDEQWSNRDTCDLIIKKLKGESPIQYNK